MAAALDTSTGNQRERDTKPFLRAIRDRVAKVALKQTQHENQSEERIKAGRK